MLSLTIVMVSHDLQSIYDTLDKVAIIDNKKIAYEGDLNGVSSSQSEFVKTFFKERI
jgi:phospholipid/cholesterol/gamma-HCH transport system ATP-binding protein